MNFMGMGLLEMGVVFLMAFLVLGPSRTIDTARTAGRLLRDLRRNFTEVMDAVNLERDQQGGPQGRVPTDGPPGQDDPPTPGQGG